MLWTVAVVVAAALFLIHRAKRRAERIKTQKALALATAFHRLGWNFLRGTGEPAVEEAMERVGLFEPSSATETTCTEAMTAAYPGSGVPMPLVPSRAKPMPLTAMWHQGVPEYVEMEKRRAAAG